MMVHIVENTEEHLDYDMILRKAGRTQTEERIQRTCTCDGNNSK